MKNGQRHQFSDVGYMCILIIWPFMEGDTILVLSNQTEVLRTAMEMIFTWACPDYPRSYSFLPSLPVFALFLPNHQRCLMFM